MLNDQNLAWTGVHAGWLSWMINKSVDFLRTLSNLLPRAAIITIYKAFIRPHLDYSDVLYDKAFNN